MFDLNCIQTFNFLIFLSFISTHEFLSLSHMSDVARAAQHKKIAEWM